MATMLTPVKLAEFFNANLQIIQAQTKGLAHEQSLLQPPFRGNCLNWVLGHILGGRDDVLNALGAEKVLNPQQAKRYGYGSQPICRDEEGILRMERILELLQISQERLNKALQTVTEATLAEERVMGPFREPCSELVMQLFAHDSYHTGQTDILRQLAGTNDKVI
jgi:uncharacterized damage-inducible protein DinB